MGHERPHAGHEKPQRATRGIYHPPPPLPSASSATPHPPSPSRRTNQDRHSPTPPGDSWVILVGGGFRTENSKFSDFQACPAPKTKYVLAAGTHKTTPPLGPGHFSRVWALGPLGLGGPRQEHTKVSRRAARGLGKQGGLAVYMCIYIYIYVYL